MNERFPSANADGGMFPGVMTLFASREWSPPLLYGDHNAREFLASTSLCHVTIGAADVIDMVFPPDHPAIVGEHQAHDTEI